MTAHDLMTKKAIVTILRESFHGVDDHGAFLSLGPNGLLDLLRGLSAEEASIPISGDSIATHALHVSFSLDVYNEWIRGVRDAEYDWDKSWEKHAVNSDEWDELLSRIDRQYTELEHVIREHEGQDCEAVWGSIGALAHTAFHLGIIQVKFDELRQKAV